MIDFIEAIYSIQPQKTAVITDDKKFSYQDLIALIDGCNAEFNKFEKAKFIAIDSNKSIFVIAWLCFFLKNKIVYSPINQSLSAKAKQNLFQILNPDNILDSHGNIIQYNSNGSYSTLTDKDIAFILTSSGSTGKPKIIPISFENLSTFIKWSSDLFIKEKEILYSLSPINFDLSIFDIFSSFRKGATIVLPENNILDPAIHLDNMTKHMVTIFYTTPSLIRQLFTRVKNRSAYTGLKKLLLAGEKLYSTDIEKIRKIFPHTKIFNLYGPTETNVVTWHEVENSNDPIPIGIPCQYANIVLLNNNKISTEGEIYISGKTVFNGYLQHDDSVFITLNQKKYYKSNDTGYWHEGKLFFNSRTDRTIKHHGYRIDLDEIENCLLNNKKISEAAVTHQTQNLTSKIKAYLVTSISDIKEIRNYLSEYFPVYSIPGEIHIVNNLPKLISGKINYQAL